MSADVARLEQKIASAGLPEGKKALILLRRYQYSKRKIFFADFVCNNTINIEIRKDQ
jgi:hypothetical protein